jgi:hypothetical protein
VTCANLCRSCGKDFSSLEAFDAHRVGKHAHTYSEGIALEPMREDGRRCLRTDEMGAFSRGADERWYLVASRARVSRAFSVAPPMRDAA